MEQKSEPRRRLTVFGREARTKRIFAWLREGWAYDEIAPHWDKLILRAHISENGGRKLYQEGAVTAMLDPLVLIEQFVGKAGLAEGTLMFCGTLAAHGGVRAADVFEFELEDPVLARKISHRYRTLALPVLG